MTPVKQTKFYPGGNCLSAAVASLFNLSIEKVPNFIDRLDTFWDDFQAFIDSLGCEYIGTASLNGHFPTIDGCYLVEGLSPRGISHVVVYKDGQMVHDPHPDNTGLIEPRRVLAIAWKEQRK